ncbi:MAG TPA: hypothetical protein VFV17_06870, partial [Usitatibacteraceae bacterium]|nr:hypothetical protein [Usitatibacteraceae bacterium]
FLQGARVPDPGKHLQGSGNKVRHIRLTEPDTLLKPHVRSLMLAALASAEVPISPTGQHRVVIKSVSHKQRSRR